MAKLRQTNAELAIEVSKKFRATISARQVSKSRKRGWIWENDKQVKYKAPAPTKRQAPKTGKKDAKKSKKNYRQ